MALSSRKHEVDVFYDHEGLYQRQRSGLYRTSYDPKQLAAAMNAEETGCGALGDLSTLERGALDHPTALNDEMAEAVRRSRSLSGSVARFHRMPSAYELVRPHEIAQTSQKRYLQPDPPAVSAATQVGLYKKVAHTPYYMYCRLRTRSSASPVRLRDVALTPLCRVKVKVPVAHTRLPSVEFTS